MSESTMAEIPEQGWVELLEVWRHSGLSQSAWCRQNRVSFHRFRYWKKKLEGPARARPMVRVPVEVRALSEALELSCGRFTVRVRAGFDAQTLSRLLQVLEKQQ